MEEIYFERGMRYTISILVSVLAQPHLIHLQHPHATSTSSQTSSIQSLIETSHNGWPKQMYAINPALYTNNSYASVQEQSANLSVITALVLDPALQKYYGNSLLDSVLYTCIDN